MSKAQGIFHFTSDCFKKFYLSRNVHQNKLTLSPVSEDFVFLELNALNISKSTGLYEIPAKFLKIGASILKNQSQPL